MPVCEIVGSRFAARLEYQVTQDIAANCSTLHFTRVGVRSLWAGSGTNVWVLGSIRVGNTTAAVMELSSVAGCEITLSESYDIGGEGIWSGFRSWDVTVAHDADGNASVQIGLDLRVYLKNETQLSPGHCFGGGGCAAQNSPGNGDFGPGGEPGAGDDHLVVPDAGPVSGQCGLELRRSLRHTGGEDRGNGPALGAAQDAGGALAGIDLGGGDADGADL